MLLFNKIYSLLFPSNSLRALTWSHIEDNYPKLYKNREFYLVRLLRRFTNNNKLAFVVCIFLPLFVAPVCCHLHKIPFVNYLNLLVNNTEGSKEILKNNLSNAATLIGISFVVLSFIFELVKDKTHQTFHELSSIVKLYPAIGFSFGVIVFHIIVNQASNYLTTANKLHVTYLHNFSLYSSLLMIALLTTLSVLFWKLFTYFSRDAINLLSRRNLLIEAKRHILQERFVLISRHLYDKQMETLGLKKRVFHFYNVLSASNCIVLNSKEHLLHDVRLSTLRTILSSPLMNIASDDVFEFEPLHLYKSLADNQKVLSLPVRNYFQMSKYAIRECYILSSNGPTPSNFIGQKSNLISRFHQTVKQKDNTQLAEVLKSIEELYTIYHQSKQQ